ncbi:hypothetical protein [Clostridium perfringens]|nr:hypothetical protein [Clostridium perfringens]HAT4318886.1 hypothetical protein [Clostridium perfringens]
MNLDGVIVKEINNGPGRCAVKSRIDISQEYLQSNITKEMILDLIL